MGVAVLRTSSLYNLRLSSQCPQEETHHRAVKLETRLKCEEPGLLDSVSAESVGVYEGMYRSKKYRGGPSSDGIGPIA
jgi:hypothetical protein